jgi:hypothetical protein
MAYFSNGSEGSCFDLQCSICKYGMDPCPIAFAQMEFNYDQLRDTTGTARKILNSLVDDGGNCAMFKAFKKDLKVKDST